MYERLKRLYDTGKLSKESLHFYVNKGLITEEQYIEIVGVENLPKQ